MSIMVNGKAYDWADVGFPIPGLNIEPQSIDYSDELEKEAVYGIGNRPRGYGTGNYKAEGKITLLRDDYDALLDYAKRQGKSLYDLFFPKVPVSYASGSGRTRTDMLSGVTFTKQSHKAAQGDKSIKVDLDFLIINGIKRDGVAA